MKKLILIFSLMLAQTVSATCLEEVRTAAINFRAARSSTNTDFDAQTQLLTQRGNTYYYFVQVDVSRNSTGEDLSSWVVKVVAKKSSYGCKIVQISL